MTTTTPTPDMHPRERFETRSSHHPARSRRTLLAAAIALAAIPASFAGEPSLIEMPVSPGLKAGAAAPPSDKPGLGLSLAGLELPQRYYADIPSSWVAAQNDKARSVSVTPQRDWASNEANKSYLIPALEIVGFDLLLNLFDRAYFGGSDYDTNFSTIKRNLRRSWVVENDPYAINQLGHPYQGSMYNGFARSAGLNFWESLGYTFAGSLFWEIAGETTPPSKNDQVASGVGGTFLGEALYRMANLVLEQGGGLSPKWREVAAAVISPPTGFNRLAFDKRFDAIYSSRNAGYYSRIALGVSGTPKMSPGHRRR